jgi:hypothetical protein
MASLNCVRPLRRGAALRAGWTCGQQRSPEKSLTSGFVFTTQRGRPISPYTLDNEADDR